jgi:ABC-type Fe3+ transport system permease subunit
MYQSFWITLFQFAPLIGFFVTFFTVLYGTNKNLDEAELASITAVKLYKIFGAILFLLHCFTLYLLAQSNTLSIKFFLETSSSSHLSPSLFLFADGLFLFLSLSIFIGAEQGFFAFLGYLALSLLIGPASCFLLYAVNREELLMKRIKQVHETSQSKKKN